MYGLNEELFMSCFHAFEAETSLPWQVKGIPDVGFYKALHPYLTKFKSSITKITIGKFYIAIDSNLRAIIVVNYCPSSKTHEVEYEGDDTIYSFDLIVDILNDDLIIVAVMIITFNKN